MPLIGFLNNYLPDTARNAELYVFKAIRTNLAVN
jgi:hypothetical protein